MKYSAGESYSVPGVEVKTGINISQFDDIEVSIAFETAKELHEMTLFNVGIGGTIMSSPILHDGILYFGSNDTNFYAVTIDGKELWRFATQDPVLGTARLYDDTIYIGSYDGNMYALDLEGNLKWRFSTESKVFCVPLVRDGRLYFGSSNGNLYCLDPRNGKQLWRFSTTGGIISTPIYREGVVFFGSLDKNIYAINADTGNLVWRYATNGMIINSNKRDNSVYKNIMFYPAWDNNIYAITFSGSLVWRFGCKDIPYPGTIHEGKLYFGSRDGNLYCIDAETGREIWRFHTEGYIAGDPVFYKDRLYIGSGDNNMYCLTTEGKKLWSFATNGANLSSPATDDKGVYFGSWDCNLYAVSHKGRLLWKFHTSLSYQSPIDLKSPGAGKTSHDVVWVQETGERQERYEQNIPGRFSDYGGNIGSYQSIGIKTEYALSGEKKYKTKSEYR
ncbi:MAG: PQQ-like beta-propeller repeat protein [Candidatus Aenigmarchaeota archaeon]|nr:PQQ-like beta-propeller repeat protein [Candidatus Aenigmarchaeota archaeon]